MCYNKIKSLYAKRYVDEYLFFTDFQLEEISVSSVSPRLWTLTFIILYRWSALYASLDQVARRHSNSIWSGKRRTWMNEQFQMTVIRPFDSGGLLICRFHNSSSKVRFGKARKPPRGLRWVLLYHITVYCDRGVYFDVILQKVIFFFLLFKESNPGVS